MSSMSRAALARGSDRRLRLEGTLAESGARALAIQGGRSERCEPRGWPQPRDKDTDRPREGTPADQTDRPTAEDRRCAAERTPSACRHRGGWHRAAAHGRRSGRGSRTRRRGERRHRRVCGALGWTERSLTKHGSGNSRSPPLPALRTVNTRGMCCQSYAELHPGVTYSGLRRPGMAPITAPQFPPPTPERRQPRRTALRTSERIMPPRRPDSARIARWITPWRPARPRSSRLPLVRAVVLHHVRGLRGEVVSNSRDPHSSARMPDTAPRLSTHSRDER
jgi:hypothetical protein